MLKVELHTHTADDPVDTIRHSTAALIHRAASLGYDAIAVTLHDKQLDLEPYQPLAERLGIVLIPGIERTIEGKHVLLLNFRRGTEDVQSFADLAALRQRERGLVVAPHPFFPAKSCVGELLDRYADLFDAVEYNAMFTRGVNFNRRAEQWARAHGKPLVGNCDVHLLEQLGTVYSLVDAKRSADAICEAIADGRVEIVATPHAPLQAGWLFTRLLIGTAIPSRLKRHSAVDAVGADLQVRPRIS